MTKKQRMTLKGLFPFVKCRIFRLSSGEIIGDCGDQRSILIRENGEWKII